MLEAVEARRLLGEAVFDYWGSLPRDIQEAIFERAVHQKSEKIRTELAMQLHEAHPRTDHD